MQKIGFIGIGKVGLAVCRNLIAAGYEVHGYRRSSLADFEALGGIAEKSVRDVAENSDVILTCVNSDAAMTEVVSGANGLVSSARPGQIIACFSSHTVPMKQGFADAMAKVGCVLLDGEVSGTPGMIEARKATVYLAGPKGSVDQVEPIIKSFANENFYLGKFGDATKVKLINNLMVATQIVGTAQAMAIGMKMGIDSKLMIEAVGKGSGSSTQFLIRAPWMAERRFTPPQGSAPALLHYVIGARDAAIEAGTSTELVDKLIDIFNRAIPLIEERDVAAMFEFFERPSKN